MNNTKTYSDFWLNQESLDEYIPKNDVVDSHFSIDLIKLTSYRRAVANFVYILTHKDIPVKFATQEELYKNESYTDGKQIFLSASIRRKEDFDWSVGLSLHEASHILLTDFNVIENIFSKIPVAVPLELKVICRKKRLTDDQIGYLCRWVWNYIEDRFIDSFVFREAPGYRGYYKALYDKFFNDKLISKALKSKALRIPNLLSYEYRLVNLTNPDSDYDALPGLRKIVEMIDMNNIMRLVTTKDRLHLSYKVVEIIVNNIKSQPKKKGDGETTMTVIHKQLSSEPSKKGSPGKPQKTEENKPEEPIEEEEDTHEATDAGNTIEFRTEELDDLNQSFNKQRGLIQQDYQVIKETVSDTTEKLSSIIEQSGVEIKPTAGDMADCVVVKKMSQQLIDAGQSIFPLTCRVENFDSFSKPSDAYSEAVNKGFVLGRRLGRKLQIRGEENTTQYIRKPSGKITKRLLAEIGTGNQNIFTRFKTDRYNKTRLHISVDASGSMKYDDKWQPTITCVTAICVAASMVSNLDVSVSFRSTIGTSVGKFAHTELPYIIKAYDSREDKISKIRNLFPCIVPNGGTPEGLAFEAVANEFILGNNSMGQDYYFLNISDGEPCCPLISRTGKNNIDYMGENAAYHTKQQIDKLRAKGVKILSYFIDGNDDSNGYNSLLLRNMQVDKKRQLTLKQLFDIMYGKDGKCIDVGNITEISNTINNLFLSKQ